MGRILYGGSLRKKPKMNMIIRRAANHLFYLFKVYAGAACIGAFSMMAFAIISAYPWIGALLFFALEVLLIAFFILRKRGLIIEFGGVRIEFGKKPSDPQVVKH
jgi:hypothetical protein